MPRALTLKLRTRLSCDTTSHRQKTSLWKSHVLPQNLEVTFKWPRCQMHRIHSVLGLGWCDYCNHFRVWLLFVPSFFFLRKPTWPYSHQVSSFYKGRQNPWPPSPAAHDPSCVVLSTCPIPSPRPGPPWCRPPPSLLRSQRAAQDTIFGYLLINSCRTRDSFRKYSLALVVGL